MREAWNGVGGGFLRKEGLAAQGRMRGAASPPPAVAQCRLIKGRRTLEKDAQASRPVLAEWRARARMRAALVRAYQDKRSDVCSFPTAKIGSSQPTFCFRYDGSCHPVARHNGFVARHNGFATVMTIKPSP